MVLELGVHAWWPPLLHCYITVASPPPRWNRSLRFREKTAPSKWEKKLWSRSTKRRKKGRKTVDLSKGARLDYFGHGTRSFRCGIYPRDRPIPRERSSSMRIRCARDKQESFDACLREGRKRGYAISGWLYVTGEYVYPTTLAELRSDLLNPTWSMGSQQKFERTFK